MLAFVETPFRSFKLIADDVQRGFPDGIAVPRSIRAVCDYLDEHGYPISGCFEIESRGKDAITSWFNDDDEMKGRFAAFGHGSTGSTYALWLQPDRDAERAPVVLLGSEGDFLALAGSADDFCRLLGCGYNELEWDDLTQPPMYWNETIALRTWLHERCGLTFPKTGEEIVQVARKRCPDFGDMIRKWQADNL